MNRLILVFLVCVIINLSIDVSRASVMIQSVGFGGVVFDGVMDDSVGFQASTSPFANSHSISQGDWFYSSQHSGEFNDQQGMVIAQDSIGGRKTDLDSYSIASGGISLRTQDDILVSLEGFMTYALPGQHSEAVMTLSISRFDFSSGDSTNFYYAWDGLVAPKGPESGVAHLQHSMLLPPTISDSYYTLSYDMSHYSGKGHPANLGLLTADGSLSISYQVVPEPTLLGLMVCFGLFRRVRHGD